MGSTLCRDDQTSADIAERIVNFEKQSREINKEADMALHMGQVNAKENTPTVSKDLSYAP